MLNGKICTNGDACCVLPQHPQYSMSNDEQQCSKSASNMVPANSLQDCHWSAQSSVFSQKSSPVNNILGTQRTNQQSVLLGLLGEMARKGAGSRSHLMYKEELVVKDCCRAFSNKPNGNGNSDSGRGCFNTKLKYWVMLSTSVIAASSLQWAKSTPASEVCFAWWIRLSFWSRMQAPRVLL